MLHLVHLVVECLFHFNNGVFFLEQAHMVSSLIVFSHPQLTGAADLCPSQPGIGVNSCKLVRSKRSVLPFRRAVLRFRTTHGCGGFLRRSLNDILIGMKMAVML